MLKKIKIISSIIILMSILSLNTGVQAKYSYTEIETTVKFNIDRTAPVLEVEYADYEDYMQVTIKANEQIKLIDGWKINDDNTVLTKNYYENTEEKITIYDISDNCTDAQISVNVVEPIEIEVISVKNTNTRYEKYANNTSEIAIIYEINAVARLADRLDIDDILVKIDGNIVEDIKKELYWTLDNKTKYQYKLILKNIKGNGMLDIEVKEDALRIITNEVDTTNKAYEYKTGIKIDNIAPSVKTLEEETESGHAKLIISSNESLRLREGWEYEENESSMSKEFPANVSYQITVMDLAGNSIEAKIDVTVATYINLMYGSHNLNYGWLFAEKMGEIAGKDAVLAGGDNPTECLAFRLEGNVEPDFVQARAYVYSHWTETLGVCNETKNTYCFGYNPYDGMWRTMKNAKLAIIDGKEYFTFGGVGLNKEGQCDVNGENPISNTVARNVVYGITAIKFKLVDYSEYSVIYQFHTLWNGWLHPSYNGKENSMGYPTTISGIRVTIVPNSELQSVYDFWAKDC